MNAELVYQHPALVRGGSQGQGGGEHGGEHQERHDRLHTGPREPLDESRQHEKHGVADRDGGEDADDPLRQLLVDGDRGSDALCAIGELSGGLSCRGGDEGCGCGEG